MSEPDDMAAYREGLEDGRASVLAELAARAQEGAQLTGEELGRVAWESGKAQGLLTQDWDRVSAATKRQVMRDAVAVAAAVRSAEVAPLLAWRDALISRAESVVSDDDILCWMLAAQNRSQDFLEQARYFVRRMEGERVAPLLARIETMEIALRKLCESLPADAFVDMQYGGYCVSCNATVQDFNQSVKHTPDCAWVVACNLIDFEGDSD